jgi:hypothetical protein
VRSATHCQNISKSKKGKSWIDAVKRIHGSDAEKVLNAHANKLRTQTRDNNPMRGKKWRDVVIKKHGFWAAIKVLEAHAQKSKLQNGMAGKSIYEVWVQKYGTEEADKRHAQLCTKRSKNARGESNPMHGKPAPKNSGGGWSGWYHERYFRSLLELSFMLQADSRGVAWQSAEDMLSITYEFNGQMHTYKLDFFSENKWIEIKPSSLLKDAKNIAKWEAAKSLLGDKFVILTEKDFAVVDAACLKRLCDSGELRLVDKWAKRLSALCIR